MRKAAKKLNLKPHRIGQQEVLFYGPGDMEIHRGTDSRIYIVDTARLFCPELPQRGGAAFYRLLRPEFVRNYHKPLSSDAFTGWGFIDKDVHNSEAKAATEYLLNVTIPNFGKALGEDLKINISQLTENLHQHGINVRHLGLVRQHVKSAEFRDIILIEMICRSLKNDLRHQLRQSTLPIESEYQQSSKNFFLQLNTDSFWKGPLLNSIIERFGDQALIEVEKARFGSNYIAEQHMFDMFAARVQSMLGISVERAKNGKIDVAVNQSLTRVKHIPLIAFEEGVSLQHLADHSTDASNSIRIYKQACKQYKLVIAVKPYAVNALYNWGKCCKSRAVLEPKRALFQKAILKYEIAEKFVKTDDPILPNILFNKANAMFEFAKLCWHGDKFAEGVSLAVSSVQLYLSASRLAPNEKLIQETFLCILRESNRYTKMKNPFLLEKLREAESEYMAFQYNSRGPFVTSNYRPLETHPSTIFLFGLALIHFVAFQARDMPVTQSYYPQDARSMQSVAIDQKNIQPSQSKSFKPPSQNYGGYVM